jgi:hypothetical protein
MFENFSSSHVQRVSEKEGREREKREREREEMTGKDRYRDIKRD